LHLDSQNAKRGKQRIPMTSGAMIWAFCQVAVTPPASVNGTRNSANEAIMRMMPITSSCQNSWLNRPKPNCWKGVL
jgi:hypothetical protein